MTQHHHAHVPFHACVTKSLPKELTVKAAELAVSINPANAPAQYRLPRLAALGGPTLTKEHLAAMSTKWWSAKGHKFGVKFLWKASADLQKKILDHANAWGEFCNVMFSLSTSNSAEVRVNNTPGDGYWAYVGMDCLLVDSSEPTMNLDSFSLSVPDSEYRRVVRHEFGHILGFPHEHMRRELVDRLDPEKTKAWFWKTYRWSATDVTQQVLTPLDEAELLATPHADEDSIMCYVLPGDCTKDGKPIRGGLDIDKSDQEFAGSIMPLPVKPPPPPSSKLITGTFSIDPDKKTGTMKVA